jgi:hypothetical protein
MDVLDKFFIQYAYKFPKGYPDMNNDQDVLLMESILGELDVKINLREAKTAATEDLHEIFTAMFVAGHKPISKEEFFTADWGKEVNLPKLNKQSLHSDVIKSYIGKDKTPKPEYYKLYQDAQSIASQINTKLGYPNGLIGVERVFGSGDSGKKIKADIISYQNIDGLKDKVDISLKYGKGQFNSLSGSEVLSLLYNIPKGDFKGLGKGLLKQIYDKDPQYKESIDKGVRDYLKFIINNYKKIDTNNSPLTPELKKVLDGFDTSLLDTITWPEWIKLKNPYHRAFRKALASKPLTTLKKDDFLPSKQVAINGTIEKFLEQYKGKDKDQNKIKSLLGYILGSDENDSYLYVAEGGKKFTFIPSKKRIKSHEYEIEENVKSDSANYQVDIIVKDKKSGLPLFEFDILLRFAGEGGQYTSDLSQKGSNFKIYQDNFNEIFYP